MNFDFRYWVRLAIINLLLVSFIGVIMRYKIGFEFPYFNQKNLQHAHSHFAFAGWISLMIMLLMLYNIRNYIPKQELKKYKRIFNAQNLIAYGMLFSFAFQGYAALSITFSSLSIIVSFWFCFQYFNDNKQLKKLPGIKWFNMAMLYNILSTLGTFSLSYMMATKQIGQHSYLASVYWYLHFQYNGWFFFSCVGILVNYLFENGIQLINENKVYKLFSVACLPAYGLSVLWLNLPLWLYIIVILAAIIQVFGLFIFIKEIIIFKLHSYLKINLVSKLLLICITISICSKVVLQLGSTVPGISKFAFGFRPIVIAYLHLVLLAFTSLFLINAAYLNDLLIDSKSTRTALLILLIGIVLNELLLGIQGVFSITYTMVPFANEMLFYISILIFIGIFKLFLGILYRNEKGFDFL